MYGHSVQRGPGQNKRGSRSDFHNSLMVQKFLGLRASEHCIIPTVEVTQQMGSPCTIISSLPDPNE